MNSDFNPSPVDLSMLGILRMEAEGQIETLTSGLLELERDPAAAAPLAACMRAAHSLKGASRIVGLAAGVGVAHAMEDCFVAAQEGRPPLDRARINLMLRGIDLLAEMSQVPDAEIGRWTGKLAEVDIFVAEVARSLSSSASGRNGSRFPQGRSARWPRCGP